MKRPLTLLLGVAGFVIVSKLLVENVLGIDIEPWLRAWLTHAGTSAAVVVIGLLVADILLPIPSSLVMILSGAAFGVAWGSVIALVGSIAGEWLGFEMARAFGPRVTRWVGGTDDQARLERAFVRHGAATVAITRALPVVMETMSVMAGLSKMGRGAFLLASLIGTAPIVVAYAYAGAMSRDTGSLVPAIIISIAVAGAGWVWYRARLGATPPEPSSSAALRDSPRESPRP